MGEKKILALVWVILVILMAGGLVLAAKVSHLSLKNEFRAEHVAQLLTMFFVLSLFVERTLEIFITAWRGEETISRTDELQKSTQALTQNPTDAALQKYKHAKKDRLTAYKCETRAIALRSGLVLGILIAAVGIRAFNIFVEVPAVPPDSKFWLIVQGGLFNVLDVLVCGGLIGGGSNAIHKMMNVITDFFEKTSKRLKKP